MATALTAQSQKRIQEASVLQVGSQVHDFHSELASLGLPVDGPKVTVLNFFATWCGICMREQPKMIKLSEEIGVPIYTIMWRSPEESVLDWKKNTRAYEHVALDYTGETGIMFGIMGVPHTFLVDKRGRIRYSYVGNLSDKEINSRLIPLVKKYQDEK
jgi:cytochrome c biogenesis protein CcmG/thiol:disulfide interchange protein DsbE